MEIKATHATWLGRPGTDYTGTVGQQRIVGHVWNDETTAEVRLLSGDARKGTLVEHFWTRCPADQVIETMNRVAEETR